MPCTTEQDICNFFISKSKDLEAVNVSEAKAWLLTGRSMLPTNFQIQLQSFLLEKRQKNVEGCAQSFENLFKMFPTQIIEEVNEMANAVQAVTLNTQKATDEDIFMCKVFNTLNPVEMRMEVLMHWSQHTPIILEKCQSVLLMVKLFPNVVNQHGGNMLYTLSGCDADSDVYSPFRKHLVTELVPAVLRLCKNLHPSPALITLLNQCIEYYVLVDDKPANEEEDEDSQSQPTEQETKWDKLYGVVDQIGTLLNWSIAPFFRDAAHNSGSVNVKDLFKALEVAVRHSNHYTPAELAYIAVIIFLRCITAYYDKLSAVSSPSPTARKHGEKSKLALVEVFLPLEEANSSGRNRNLGNLPVITTVSTCPSVNFDPGYLLLYFTTASGLWQMIENAAGDSLEKEFFGILSAMKSLNFRKWSVFQEFDFDFKTYTGKHTHSDLTESSGRTQSHLKLASMFCSAENYKTAAEYAIKAVTEISLSSQTPTTPLSGSGPITSSPSADSRKHPMARSRSISSSGPNTKPPVVNFSFYNCPAYAIDNNDQVIAQRRVHFISENKSEILAYAVNVLTHCLYNALDVAIAQKDDSCLGHLMVLLQLEWYSSIADLLLTQILDVIRRKGSFRYFPHFADYVIEPDILEQFMVLSSTNDSNSNSTSSTQGKTSSQVSLDIFTGGSGNSSSSRRMGTRGVERGAKSDFKACMKKQMLKNARENLETLLIKFFTQNQVDLLACLDV